MGAVDTTIAGVWQARGQWRSRMGGVVAVMLLITACFGLWAVLHGPGPVTVVGVLLNGWLAWVLGKPLFTRDWILRVGPRGISGHMLRGRTVPWQDVQDLRVETVQGNTTLVVQLLPGATESLRKTRRWLQGRKPERRIVLTALQPQVAQAGVEAALQTFFARGGANAQAAAEARAREAEREQAFAAQLAAAPRPWSLWLLVALNVGVWVANVAGGMSPMQPLPADLYRWGANSAWAVGQEQAWWRLLASTFLHGGLIHLAMNMVGLWGAGTLLCRLLGNGQFLLLYLASGLAGASASLHFSAQTAVSVGASGAVFGVLAALIVVVRRERAALPQSVVRGIFTSEAVFLLYALGNGFARSGIDNAAHVGGLLAGAGMGWLLLGLQDARPRLPRAALATALVAAAIGVLVATVPASGVDHGRLFPAAQQMQQLAPRVQAAYVALQEDPKAAQAGRLAPEALTRALQERHLPQLRALAAELRAVPRPRNHPASGLLDAMQEQAETVAALLELQVRALQGDAGEAEVRQSAELKRRAEALARRVAEGFEALKPPQRR